LKANIIQNLDEPFGQSSLLRTTSPVSGANPTPVLGFFDQKPLLHAAIVAVLVLLAGAIRLYNLKAPGVLIDREYTSAILARDFYFEHNPPAEEWRKEIAHITRQNLPILEPPVTEFLVSLIYQVVGREQLWLARLPTSLFWLVGGIFLYKIVSMVAAPGAAVLATAYYLFLPPSILLSRSFQPDSLMMMLFLISLFAILKYYEGLSDLRLVMAAGVSGLALLYRPLILFTLLGAFTALAIHQSGTWKRFLNRRFLTFVTLSLLPSVVYYGYAIFVAGFMRWKVETSFRPDLLLHREFWRGWLELAVDGVGYTALIAALLGVPLLFRGLPRALVAGLGIGYVAFGLVFTMHIHTHGYYQAQLIPIVALAFSPLVTLVMNQIGRMSKEWYRWLPAIGAVLLALLFSVREVHRELAASRNFESEAIAKEIGEFVHHSSRTVYLAPYYGLPLQYYGELAGAYWPRKESYYLYPRPDDRARSIQERLDALGFAPEYFVVTHFTEYAAHHIDLKEYLVKNCSLLVDRHRYQIYHLCSP
jgi:hypothetical protein